MIDLVKKKTKSLDFLKLSQSTTNPFKINMSINFNIFSFIYLIGQKTA